MYKVEIKILKIKYNFDLDSKILYMYKLETHCNEYNHIYEIFLNKLTRKCDIYNIVVL